jgi:hypothetical protein
MKDGSLVIEIDHTEELKENFFIKLENFLDDLNISHKTYRVSNGNLIASVVSKPVRTKNKIPLNLSVYAPFYKITRLEKPDEEKATKLLERYLNKR